LGSFSLLQLITVILNAFSVNKIRFEAQRGRTVSLSLDSFVHVHIFMVYRFCDAYKILLFVLVTKKENKSELQYGLISIPFPLLFQHRGRPIYVK